MTAALVESGRPATRRTRCRSCGELPPKPRAARVRKSEEELLEGVSRQLTAVGKRAKHSLETLATLHNLRDQIDVMTYEAVASLRADGTNVPASWAEIGKALDITKQSAQERFAKAGGHRLRGGQPARWR